MPRSSPDHAIKQGTKPPGYIRTVDEVEVIGRRGGLLSVGREGSLTGNRVDCFILDDLYKDALEANSPIVRANCWEWYTSVVRTRAQRLARTDRLHTLARGRPYRHARRA